MPSPRRPILVMAALGLAGAAAAQPLSLTTLFASNNGLSSSGSMSFFDVTVLNPSGLRIVGLDVNSIAAANVVLTLDVYLAPTTFAGKEKTAAAWTKISSGKGITVGRDLATPMDIGDFFLAPGSYGLAFQYLGGGNAYTNGTGSNQAYGNADLSLALGSSISGFFTGTYFNPRVWNGTIYYATPVQATYGVLGTGCKGSNGSPSLKAAAGSWPKIGGLFTLDAAGLPAPAAAAVLMLGVNKASWAGLPLPFDLTAFGMPGCTLHLAMLFGFGLPNTGGAGRLPLGIPGDPALLGAPFVNQLIVLDPGANPAGLTFSNGGEGQVGR